MAKHNLEIKVAKQNLADREFSLLQYIHEDARHQFKIDLQRYTNRHTELTLLKAMKIKEDAIDSLTVKPKGEPDG